MWTQAYLNVDIDDANTQKFIDMNRWLGWNRYICLLAVLAKKMQMQRCQRKKSSPSIIIQSKEEIIPGEIINPKVMVKITQMNIEEER